MSDIMLSLEMTFGFGTERSARPSKQGRQTRNLYVQKEDYQKWAGKILPILHLIVDNKIYKRNTLLPIKEKIT